MLMYVTLKPANVVFGLDQETVREDSVTLLKTISVAGSGPGERKQGDFYSQVVSERPTNTYTQQIHTVSIAASTKRVPGSSGGSMHK